jgi:hypothetical protein
MLFAHGKVDMDLIVMSLSESQRIGDLSSLKIKNEENVPPDRD